MYEQLKAWLLGQIFEQFPFFMSASYASKNGNFTAIDYGLKK